MRPRASEARAPRVLIAVSGPVRRRMAEILADWDLRFVDSSEQLLHALDESEHELLIVGSHFEESGAMAVLERVLGRDDSPPVVCIRGAPFAAGLGQPTIDALRLASRELGVQYFIDLMHFPDDAEGNGRVRHMLQRLLSVS